jgi:hypothetical protein
MVHVYVDFEIQRIRVKGGLYTFEKLETDFIVHQFLVKPEQQQQQNPS